MRLRGVVALAAAAAALLAAGLWLQRTRDADDAPAARALVPGLEARLNAIRSLTIDGAGVRRLVTLERTPQGWTLRERAGWRVDTDALRAWLLALAQAQRVEAKTALPRHYARLGVGDVADADAQGLRVTIRGDGAPIALIVGRAQAQGRGGYVRFLHEARSWLVDRDLTPEREPAAWLDRDLVDVPTANVVAVELTPADAAAFRIVRDGGRFVLADMPRGRRLAGEYAAESTATVLDALRFDDLQRDEAAAAEPALTARFKLVDGRRILVSAWRRGGKVHARFASEADPTADAQARRAADALQARLAGWRFVLPPNAAVNLMRGRDEYLAPKNAHGGR